MTPASCFNFYIMFQLIRRDSGEGVVFATGKGRIFVASLADSVDAAPQGRGCGGRAGCGSCGGCASLPGVYADRFHIPVPHPAEFKPGDHIRFNRYIPEPNIVSALVFGVPITGAIAAMVLWLLNAPERSESSLAVLTIGAAFLGGVIILALLDLLFKKRYPATVVGGCPGPRCGSIDSGEQTI